jgi:hypothetical protein
VLTSAAGGIGAGDTTNPPLLPAATIPDAALSPKVVALALAGIDAVQLTEAPVVFVMVTIAVGGEAGKLAPHVIIGKSIEDGVTLIAGAAVGVPIIVKLMTGKGAQSGVAGTLKSAVPLSGVLAVPAAGLNIALNGGCVDENGATTALSKVKVPAAEPPLLMFVTETLAGAFPLFVTAIGMCPCPPAATLSNVKLDTPVWGIGKNDCNTAPYGD